MKLKSYKDGLRDRLQCPTYAEEYLRAAIEEKDEALLKLAVEDVVQANRVARDLLEQSQAEVARLKAELEAARKDTERVCNFVANLRSAYFHRPMNGHGWRLIETDCGAMRRCGEGATPLEAIRAAIDAARGGK